MKILTRDDTEHNVEYVTRSDAEREIEAWKEKADCWQSLCTLYADERNELRDAVKNLRDVKGRHHTEMAARALYALLPENVRPLAPADNQTPTTQKMSDTNTDPNSPQTAGCQQEPCSLSSTPRTDEHLSWRKIINCGQGPIGTEVCEAEWARRLERELNEAHRATRQWIEAWDRYGDGASLMHPRLTMAITAARKSLPENAKHTHPQTNE